MKNEHVNSDEKKSYTEQISDDITELKTLKPSERISQYGKIGTGIKVFLDKTATAKFEKDLIKSFFTDGDFKKEMKRRHIKAIIDFMLKSGFIVEDLTKKVSLQQRAYELKSNDYESYSALMSANGYNVVEYFEYIEDESPIFWAFDSVINSDGESEIIARKNKPIRKKLIATSRINGLPVDKNGEDVKNYDESILKATKQRRHQGVFSYGNKSLAVEKRAYNTKCYNVVR